MTREYNTRREFLKNTGRVAAASALTATSVPLVHAGEDNTIRVAVIGCGGRGTGAAANALTVKHGPSSWSPWPTLSRTGSTAVTRRSKRQLRRPGRRARGSPIRRLRRLQEGDGLPEAGRRGDLCNAAGVSLGTLRLRDREGAERLHGKAADRRWPDFPQDVASWPRKPSKEPEGGRGPDVAIMPGPPGMAERIHGGEIGDIVLMRGYRMDGPVAAASSAQAGRQSATWNSRSASSTASSGPAAAASAISTSTSSTIAAG